MAQQIADPEILTILDSCKFFLKRRNFAVAKESIEDVVAEVLYHWLRDASTETKSDSNQSFGWIILRAQTLLIDTLRRESKSFTINSESDYEGRTADATSDDVDRKIDLDLFLSTLGKYSFEQIVAIVYCDFFGYPPQAVANGLHCSNATARQHHSRAMKNLRKIANGTFAPPPSKKNK